MWLDGICLLVGCLTVANLHSYIVGKMAIAKKAEVLSRRAAAAAKDAASASVSASASASARRRKAA